MLTLRHTRTDSFGLAAHADRQQLLALWRTWTENSGLVARRSGSTGLVARKARKFEPWVPQAQCSGAASPERMAPDGRPGPARLADPGWMVRDGRPGMDGPG